MPLAKPSLAVVVDLAAYREERARTFDAASRPIESLPQRTPMRPLTMKAVEHRRRMFDHLTTRTGR